jgi:hypothetical protein
VLLERGYQGLKRNLVSGAPHGLTATLQDEVNADLLGFLEQEQEVLKAAG